MGTSLMPLVLAATVLLAREPVRPAEGDPSADPTTLGDWTIVIAISPTRRISPTDDITGMEDHTVIGATFDFAPALMLLQVALLAGLAAPRGPRRRATSRTRNAAAHYRTAVETQSDLICRFLPDTTLTFVNDAYCRFFNKRREDLIGTKWLELIPAPLHARVLDRIRRVTDASDAHEHEVMLPDGSVGWMHWVNQAIADDDGRVSELQAVGRDITDRKRAEEALGELETRNSAMLRAIPDLMLVLNRDGTYLDYHARDPKLLFLTPEAFIGKRVQDIMPPLLAQLFQGAIERALVEAGPVVIEYVLAMGEPRYYEARVVNAGNDRVLSIVRDVTESRQAMQLNRDLVGRLITAQEEERRWLARELHDGVLQDIAAVSAGLAELRHAQADGRAREQQAAVLKAQKRINALAENLRLLSHGLHPTVLQHVGLMAALKSHCVDFERQRRVHVDFLATCTHNPASSSVSLSLFRITQEALRNAARHGEARHVTVSLVRDDTHLSLRVSDDGRGFDVSSARHQGGLGLVSIEERARLVQASVTIDSVPGKGTEVVVRVPVDVVDRLEAQPSEPMQVIRPRQDRAASP
jgi:PAS domain S-box-containing protein